MGNRDIVIDQAKGFGMILLFLGHLFSYGNDYSKIIFSFHMPLFFFISGMYFKQTYEWKAMIKKIARRYLLPYCIFNATALTIYIFTIIILENDMANALMGGGKNIVSQFLFHLGSREIWMGSLWFLPILFLSSITLNGILLLNNKRNIFFSAIVIFILIVISYIGSKVRNCPLLLNVVSGSTLFMYIGYISKILYDSFIRSKAKIYILLVVLIPFVVLSLKNEMVNISIPTYGNILICVTTALLGIIITITISQYTNLRLLSFLGQNSLIAFMCNGIWYNIYALIISCLYGIEFRPMDNMPNYLCLVGGMFIVLMSIPSVVLIRPLLNKICK